MNRLVCLPGIVTAASKPRHKATSITVQCQSCKMTQTLACKPGMGGAHIPRVCTLSAGTPNAAGRADCGVDPFVMLAERSAYVDQQTLKLQARALAPCFSLSLSLSLASFVLPARICRCRKGGGSLSLHKMLDVTPPLARAHPAPGNKKNRGAQERPEDIPTGELPRTLLLVADRLLASTVTPGTRVTVVGIYSTFKARGSWGWVGGRVALLGALREGFAGFCGVWGELWVSGGGSRGGCGSSVAREPEGRRSLTLRPAR